MLDCVSTWFAENTESLLLVVGVGDVVQLCCVSVNVYNGEVVVVLKKNCSSFSLYKSKDGDDLDPYISFLPTFNLHIKTRCP